MTDDSPTTPTAPKRLGRDDLLRIYRESRTIAVVGASTNPDRPAHYVPAYLQSQGYRIIPISPRGGEIFGEPVRRLLAEIDEPVDIVDVFRPANEGPQIARDAAKIGAKVVWFQPGTQSGSASAIAATAGVAGGHAPVPGHDPWHARSRPRPRPGARRIGVTLPQDLSLYVEAVVDTSAICGATERA